MGSEEKSYQTTDYIHKRKKLTGILFESALPNEYLVQVGTKKVKPVLGGRKFRIFRKFMRIPASVQTLYFKTDNANQDYQGIGVEGFASWRIDPERPTVSITTLDFFDEDNPMGRTNSELRTICVEAVRHVLSNMTIDDALKKKEEIAVNLKNQLKEVEEKWGLIFDQVGIEKVTIMSNTLFEELQSQFRDNLRLETSRTRINTDREISAEENQMREKTELEKIETDTKINRSRIETESNVKELDLEEKQKISQKEREIREDNYLKEMQFKMEQEQKEHELTLLNKDLEIKFQEIEKQYLSTQNSIEELKSDISRKQIDIERLKREISQTFTSEALTNRLIEMLPDIYQSLEIDNYTVIDSAREGGISPVTRLLSELLSTVKNSDLGWILKDNKKGGQED